MPERFDPAAFADPRRCFIAARTLLVAAHPDDETIGCGAQLGRCEDLILLHLTDGAPRNLADARRHGFADAPSYAAARARELQAALAAGRVSCRRYAFGLEDQSLAHGLAELVRRIRAAIERLRPALLLTHAYEGGHPDHDSAAFACQAATEALPKAARPLRLEFAGYHGTQAGLSWGRFLAGGEEIALALTEAERRRKGAMLACFATQAAVLAAAPRDQERLRLAPRYDFAHAPHAGPLWYERMAWGVNGSDWRAAARRALSSC